MTTRRNFIQLATAALAVIGVPAIAVAVKRKSPRVYTEVGDYPIRRDFNINKVWVDGREVQNICVAFDSGEGWAECHMMSRVDWLNKWYDDYLKKYGELPPPDYRPPIPKEKIYGVITTDPPLEEIARRMAAMPANQYV